MENFKGTKGNWSIGEHIGVVISDNLKQINDKDKAMGHSEVDYYGGLLICESVRNQADAKLIASAPELLEALINEVSILRDERARKGWTKKESFMHGRLMKAIDKAL